MSPMYGILVALSNGLVVLLQVLQLIYWSRNGLTFNEIMQVKRMCELVLCMLPFII